MASSLSYLTVAWFTVSSVLVAIDLCFVLMAPWTLHTEMQPFKTWQTYAVYDKRYAATDAFGTTQSILNAFEVLFQLFALLAFFSGAASFAHKMALTVSVMTLYKTIIYFMMEHFEGYRYTLHNKYEDWLLMVVLPSAFWIVLPLIVAYQSWCSLTAAGRLHGEERGAVKGKRH